MADVAKEISWLKQHEKIVIIFLVLLAGVFCFNKYIDFRADQKDKMATEATIATAQAQAQADLNKRETEDQQKKFEGLVNLLENQNKLLLSTIQNDNLLLARQQQRDNDLSLPELGKRWTELINSGNITFDGSKLSVDSSAAHETVSQLESVPVLKEEVSKGSQVLENKENELSEANKLNLDLTKENKSDILLLQSKDKECDAKLNAIKADSRKSKRKWFLKGVAVGASVVTYVVIHFSL